MGIEPIAFSVRVRLVIEGEQRTVPNDWIGGGAEDAMSVAVSPNDVSRSFGHLPCPSRERPRMGTGAAKSKGVLGN